MQFAREHLFEIVQEVQPLLNEHYEELCLNKERVRLDPKWEEYAALEQMGRFTVFTAREGDKLLGYSAYFTFQHMHYAGLRVAQNDVFYLAPDRRKGMAPIRFLRYCGEQLKNDGVDKIVYHAKLTNQFAQLLDLMGYSQEEVMCAKMI